MYKVQNTLSYFWFHQFHSNLTDTWLFKPLQIFSSNLSLKRQGGSAICILVAITSVAQVPPIADQLSLRPLKILQSTVSTYKQIIHLILNQVNYRMVTLLTFVCASMQVTDILELTTRFKPINFTSEIPGVMTKTV
jgi:hypothetical protein